MPDPSPLVLPESEWRARRAAHEAYVDDLLADHRRRAERGIAHPVDDFLWQYYTCRPAQLRRWHPGHGVVLAGAVDDVLRQRDYRAVRGGAAVDTDAVLQRHRGPQSGPPGRRSAAPCQVRLFRDARVAISSGLTHKTPSGRFPRRWCRYPVGREWMGDMGLNFRKSKKVGPFRFTVGKRGVSASVGVPGARITKSTTGRTTTTVGIPGSGLSYSTSRNAKSSNPGPARQTGATHGVDPALGVSLAAISKTERRDLAALATDEDKRLAWAGKAGDLSPVQAAYRWQINSKVFRWLWGPLLTLLGLVALVLIL